MLKSNWGREVEEDFNILRLTPFSWAARKQVDSLQDSGLTSVKDQYPELANGGDPHPPRQRKISRLQAHF